MEDPERKESSPTFSHLVGDREDHISPPVGLLLESHSQPQSPETDPEGDMGPERTGRVKPQREWQAVVTVLRMLLFTNALSWE